MRLPLFRIWTAQRWLRLCQLTPWKVDVNLRVRLPPDALVLVLVPRTTPPAWLAAAVAAASSAAELVDVPVKPRRTTDCKPLRGDEEMGGERPPRARFVLRGTRGEVQASSLSPEESPPAGVLLPTPVEDAGRLGGDAVMSDMLSSMPVRYDASLSLMSSISLPAGLMRVRRGCGDVRGGETPCDPATRIGGLSSCARSDKPVLPFAMASRCCHTWGGVVAGALRSPASTWACQLNSSTEPPDIRRLGYRGERAVVAMSTPLSATAENALPVRRELEASAVAFAWVSVGSATAAGAT